MSGLVWIIGSRGLLGSGVARAVARSSAWVEFWTEPLAWTDRARFAELARAQFRSLLRESERTGADWSIVWAAGVAFTSSAPEQFDAELEQFASFLSVIAAELGPNGGAGRMFLTSSAGGVYGGAASPPFTEETPIAPAGPYGTFKAKMEAEFTSFLGATQLRGVIGRVTNLFGPGQATDKAQGLISQLAVARYRTRAAFIFVPLETVRDYIYVDDCANLILRSLDRLGTQEFADGQPRVVIKILASGTAVSIASLLGYYRGIAKSAPRVVLGSSPASAFQAADLRMRSIVWPELDRSEKTPIAAGISSTMLDVLRGIAR